LKPAEIDSNKLSTVMAGLVPATHEHRAQRCSWVTGIPRFALQPVMTVKKGI
jgi:hypothetical protein